jgi:hypothetical protein
VIELQFDAFSYPALEQIIDHVAKMRMRTRGRVDMPITIRIPSFGGIKGKEHHGESRDRPPPGSNVVPSTSLGRATVATGDRDPAGRRLTAQGSLLDEGGGRSASEAPESARTGHAAAATPPSSPTAR